MLTESTEALSNTQDFDYFASFDNLDGLSTTLILLNPGNNQTANIGVSALDAAGNQIFGDRFPLAPGAREIIVLPDAYPAIQNTSGQLRVTADANNLSAICYRTTPNGSIAYSPIFNWSGMLR